MNANLLRRVNWLWKHRHTHDGDTTLDQIRVIRETVETQEDVIAGSASGAYIHLAAFGQSIAVGGEDVEWELVDLNGIFEFLPPTFPTTTAVIPKSGYYNLAVPVLEWETWAFGGSVSLWRNDAKIWPSAFNSSWSTDVASVWHPDAAHAVWFDAGDTVRLFVDHGSASAQTLAFAALSVYLVDRAGTPDWELFFVADNFGVTNDGTGWWTTDDTDNVNPALFERSVVGAVVNSYAGYDNPGAGGEKRNRGIVYADGFLWGVGNEEAVHKVDPATGAQVSEFPTLGNVDGDAGDTRRGIGYDGTNLYVTEAFSHNRVEEYNLSGVHQANHSFPAGRSLVDLTWDGTHWWATTTTDAIIRMDASFAETESIVGPTSDNRGCHWLDGFLYVMTANGLYRKAV